MPQYYNPGLYPATYGWTYPAVPQNNQATYMYQVDGENSARAWQSPNGYLPPNTIVPLFDVDGEHVYFKSTDVYGRMNPIRVGKVIFEDPPVQQLTQGQSGDSRPEYATKTDLDELKKEIRSMMNQNGRKPNYQENRGDNK